MKNKKDIIRVIALCVVILMLLIIPRMMVGCAAAEPSGGDGKSTTYAIIALSNGEKIEGEVEDWYFWGNGMIRITIDDTEYVTYGTNVTMITK